MRNTLEVRDDVIGRLKSRTFVVQPERARSLLRRYNDTTTP